MEKRGFKPVLAGSVTEATAALKDGAPAYAVVDLRLEDGDGLQVVNQIHARREDCRVVMLTGYGNIATAVAAVKAGAIDYLSKPADADDVEKALLAKTGRASRSAGKSNVCRPGSLGAHSARIRIMQPQCIRDGPPPRPCTGGRCNGSLLNARRAKLKAGAKAPSRCGRYTRHKRQTVQSER